MLDKISRVPKSRWTQDRVARLGYLVGLGWPAERIAKDPLINTQVRNVHRQVMRFGLSFREAKVTNSNSVSSKTRSVLDLEAEKRGMTPEKFIGYVMNVLANEPTLLNNILDDDESYT